MLTFLRRLVRARGPHERFADARAALAAGRTAPAIVDAAAALDGAVLEGDLAVAAGCADLWIAAIGAAGRNAEHGAAAERCLALGVRTDRVLTAFCAHAAQVAGRTDPAALEVYVEAVERRALRDLGVRRAVLRRLAHGLYVGGEEAPVRFDGRAPLLERLAAAVPRLPFPHLYLGRYAYLRGDFAGAAERLSRVVGRYAREPRVLNLFGRSLEKLGRCDEASAAYVASLTADDRQAAIHFRLGRLTFARFVDRASG